MMQMLARTRRSLSKLHQQVMNNQGDLEERIATDIAHLNVRCKELQAAVDHESLRASHECQGLKSSTEGGMDQLRGALGEKIEALSMAVGKKVGGLTDDVAALNDSLSQEKADRTSGDATLNTKLLEQVRILQLIRIIDSI